MHYYKKADKKTVIEQILQLADTKLPPWQMPFTQDLPMNYQYKNVYKGSNFYLLSLFAQLWEVRNKWLTYPGALKIGLQFSHESKKHFVTVVNWHKIKDPKDETKDHMGFSAHSVCSIDFLVNPPTKEQVGLIEPILKEPQLVIDNMPFKCKYTEESGSAYYSPAKHLVNVPPDSDFKVAAEKYAVKFHEYSHATGHHTLLNRFPDTYVMPSKEDYSQEELFAQISTMFICAATGISRETEVMSQSYCQHFWKRIKDKPQILIDSLSGGQKIADYILGTTYEQDEKDEEQDEQA